MPSVRDKCRTTVHEIRRADSVPERLTVFRRVWACIIETSRNSVAICGIFFIPIYLIIVGALHLGTCDGDGKYVDLPLWLIITGIVVFICALYFPFYVYARSKARKARNATRLQHQQVMQEKVSEEEVLQNIPCRINRVSNYAFIFLCGVVPTVGINTLRMWSDRDTCPGVVYWTAFVLTIVWALWLVMALSACFFCCCFMMIIPTCMKIRERRRDTSSEEV